MDSIEQERQFVVDGPLQVWHAGLQSFIIIFERSRKIEEKFFSKNKEIPKHTSLSIYPLHSFRLIQEVPFFTKGETQVLHCPLLGPVQDEQG